MLFGRLPQIAQNLRQGHTGALSLITYLLNVAGSAARCFTVMQELDDKFALTSAISAFVQNSVLVAQILLLGSGAAAKKAGGSKKGRERHDSVERNGEERGRRRPSEAGRLCSCVSAHVSAVPALCACGDLACGTARQQRLITRRTRNNR